MKRKNITNSKEKIFIQGIRDGVPIGLGYFAVAFSLGIVARKAGINPFQGFLASALCNASAGEYAGFTTIGALASYLEIALITLVANARYLLMSCAMSQRFAPNTSVIHRITMGFYLTDELFGIAMARRGYLEPLYSYGAILIAAPGWALGTAIGVMSGDMLPARIVSALSVALYGMFLAIIIPPARKNKIIGVLIVVCFTLSFLASYMPVVNHLSDGTRTIILTVVISAIAAILFPVKNNQEEVSNES